MNPRISEEEIKEKTEGIRLEDLGLSTRLHNCLKLGGYSDLAELMLEAPEKLSGLCNFCSGLERELFALRKFVYNADRNTIENYCAKKVKTGSIVSEMEDNLSDWTLLEVAKGRKIGPSSIVILSSDEINIQDDLTISELQFANKIRNVLTMLEVNTLKKAAFIPYHKITGIKGLGKKSVDELISVINQKLDIIDIQISDYIVFNYIIDIICDLFQPIIKKNEIVKNKQELISTIIKVCGPDPDQYSLNSSLLIEISNKNPINKQLKNIVISKSPDTVFNGIDSKSFVSVITGQATYLNVIINSIVEQLIDDKQLRIIDGKIYRYKPFLSEWLSTLEGNSKIALEYRCKGLTLEEIGEKLNLTRERIRQIVAKTIKKRPVLIEDDYAEIIKRYYFTKEEICGLFNLEIEQANYLMLVYKRGAGDIQDFLNDNSISETIKGRAARVMKGKAVIIDGEYTFLKRDSLLKQLLKTFYSEEDCTVAEFESFYMDFLAKNGIDRCEHLLFPNSRAFEARITDYGFTIAKAGHRIRYFDTSIIDINNLLDDVELDNYENMEISTLKLFREYPDIMDQYDIRDEYELHNLIRKKHHEIENYQINVLRMPFIRIGEGDRYRQVEELLYRMAPISNVELACEYEQQYGVRSETVLANFFKTIDVYYHDGLFDIEQQDLTDSEYIILKNKLTDDFYLWDTVEEIYFRNTAAPKTDAINSMTLKKLGFRVYSQYVINAKYASAEAYFINLLLKNEVLFIDDLPHGIRSIQAYYSVLTDLRDTLELIEVCKNEYRRFDSFAKEYSIDSKDILYDIGAMIGEKIAEYEYFSIELLTTTETVAEFPDIIKNPYILNSLLRIQPAIKTGRIANSYIGTKKSNELSQLGLITHLIKTDGEMGINELISKMKKKYCLDLNRSRVMYVISESEKIAYDDIYGYIYLNEGKEVPDGYYYLMSGRYANLIKDEYELIIRSETSILMIYWKDKFAPFVEYCANRNLFKMKDLLQLDFREISDNASDLNVSRGSIPEIIIQFVEWVQNLSSDTVKDQDTDIISLFLR